MSIFKRIFGICETKPPRDVNCWGHSGGRVEIHLARAPELSKPGGAIRLEGHGLPERVLVVHEPDGKFHAFQNRCQHMGRRIDPLPSNSKVRCCSVSKATYDCSGQVVLGPAKGPLKTYKIEVDEGKVIVFLE